MKRNTLTTAVVAGLTGMAGMVSVSNAVNVNPDGMGQVLLYPYYSARGGNDTLISIVNTTERGKAVKIRFIEALNSREVLDFNIYMSPYDVWTGVVTAEGEGGKIVTTDTTCTVPYFVGDSTDGVGEQAFLDFEYAEFAGTKATESDGGPQGIERTASGYIEVIEMGTMIEAAKAGEGRVEYNSKHVAGVPRDCDALVNAWTTNLTDVAATPMGSIWAGTDSTSGNTSYGLDQQRGPSGGIYGAASIINIADGTMFSYNATAIDGFYTQTGDHHTEPGSLSPSLSEGNVDTSNVFVAGAVETHTWSAPLYALNATLTHDKIMNEYVFGGVADARTEWVVTFPTKRFHTDVQTQTGVDADDPIAPFTNTWHVTTAKALNYACEDLTFVYYDREERPDPVTPDGPDPDLPIVSPKPPTPDETPEDPQLFQLCREANVIRFAASTEEAVPAVAEITKEPTRSGTFPKLGYVNFGLPFSEGWVNMNLADVDENSDVYADVEVRQSVAAQDGDKLNGLPVIGFGVTTYTNGNLGGGVLANYGGTFNHRATRAISASQ